MKQGYYDIELSRSNIQTVKLEFSQHERRFTCIYAATEQNDVTQKILQIYHSNQGFQIDETYFDLNLLQLNESISCRYFISFAIISRRKF